MHESVKRDDVLGVGLWIQKVVESVVSICHSFSRDLHHRVHKSAFFVEICEFRLELGQGVLGWWQMIVAV